VCNGSSAQVYQGKQELKPESSPGVKDGLEEIFQAEGKECVKWFVV
jgi:hypothetical protein